MHHSDTTLYHYEGLHPHLQYETKLLGALEWAYRRLWPQEADMWDAVTLALYPPTQETKSDDLPLWHLCPTCGATVDKHTHTCTKDPLEVLRDQLRTRRAETDSILRRVLPPALSLLLALGCAYVLHGNISAAQVSFSSIVSSGTYTR